MNPPGQGRSLRIAALISWAAASGLVGFKHGGIYGAAIALTAFGVVAMIAGIWIG